MIVLDLVLSADVSFLKDVSLFDLVAEVVDVGVVYVGAYVIDLDVVLFEVAFFLKDVPLYNLVAKVVDVFAV